MGSVAVSQNASTSMRAGLPVNGISVQQVRTARERDQFIAFQLKLYADDPFFVPPIAAERRDFLDARKNPFLSHTELSLFLATRGGEMVGRAAAINDSHFNQSQNTETGFF